MESYNTIRANGTGFLHLSRRLQPGERIPLIPSMAEQLQACRADREADREPARHEALKQLG